MPPRSYIVAAVVLAALVAVSLPLTLGFSVILWHGLFAMMACVLAVWGSARAAYALGAPVWIGVALASPGIVWAIDTLVKMLSMPVNWVWSVLDAATGLAFLAAVAGALKLVESMSASHPAFRAAYTLLVASALIVGVGLIEQSAAASLTKSPSYMMLARAVDIAAILVGYGSFIAAAMLITIRYDVEPWAGAAISLISAYMIYDSINQMFVVEFPDALTFWLRPVVMLVGGAAVWRMATVLRTRASRESYAQS
jgi:hypothetical protein